MTADSLLDAIETNKISLKGAISYHEGLLGILLGYGKNNAFTVFKILERPILLGQNTKSLISFHAFDETPSHINPLYFAADIFHSEMMTLQKKYQREREEIAQIYAKGNFLEIMLERLTNDEFFP